MNYIIKLKGLIMPKDYFIDSDDEAMYLEMLEELNFESALEIYQTIKDEVLNDTHLSGKARNKSYNEFTYKNLRYLILGCKYCGAEIRVKALATFIYKASLPTRMNALVPNDHLMKILYDNLNTKLEEIYKWSKVSYNAED